MNDFLKEIQEQPLALKETMNFYLEPSKGSKRLTAVKAFLQNNFVSNVCFSGMGSSLFNSILSKYYLLEHHISCTAEDTGELLRYGAAPQPENALRSLYIFVSQSGESGEIVKILNKWKSSLPEQRLWSITNTSESTLASKSYFTFPTMAGNEKSVTSKTYVTGLLVHLLLSRTIAGEKPWNPKLRKEFDKLVKILETEMEGKWENWILYEKGLKICKHLNEPSFLNYIGTGTSMSTVGQATLNYKEVTKQFAEGLSLGAFRHGPIETIKPTYQGVFLVSDKKGAIATKPVINNVIGSWGGGKVCLITNYPEIQLDGLEKKQSDNLLIIENPVKNTYLAPIYEIALLQQQFCIQAEKLGFKPGEFINSSKVTK